MEQKNLEIEALRVYKLGNISRIGTCLSAVLAVIDCFAGFILSAYWITIPITAAAILLDIITLAVKGKLNSVIIEISYENRQKMAAAANYAGIGILVNLCILWLECAFNALYRGM